MKNLYFYSSIQDKLLNKLAATKVICIWYSYLNLSLLTISLIIIVIHYAIIASTNTIFGNHRDMSDHLSPNNWFPQSITYIIPDHSAHATKGVASIISLHWTSLNMLIIWPSIFLTFFLTRRSERSYPSACKPRGCMCPFGLSVYNACGSHFFWPQNLFGLFLLRDLIVLLACHLVQDTWCTWRANYCLFWFFVLFF